MELNIEFNGLAHLYKCGYDGLYVGNTKQTK